MSSLVYFLKTCRLCYIVDKIINGIELLSNGHFLSKYRALAKVEIIIKQKPKVQYLIVVDGAIKRKDLTAQSVDKKTKKCQRGKNNSESQMK
jgi:hypothetical protein